MTDSTAGSPPEARAGLFRRGFGAFRGPWSPRDLFLLCLCPLLFAVAALGSERAQSVGYVMPGVQLNGLDVSGYAKPVLEAELSSEQAAIARHVLSVRVGPAVFRVTGADLGTQLAPDVAEQVFQAGREGNIVRQLVWRLARFSKPDVFHATVSLDDAALEEHLVAFERAALAIPREGAVLYEGKHVVATYPEAGETIQRVSARQLLTQALQARALAIELPTQGWSPTTTREAVDYAKGRFERALRGTVEMYVRSPEEADPAHSDAPPVSHSADRPGNRAPEEADDADAEERAEQARVERVAPQLFAAALQTRQKPDKPSELEVFIDPVLLDAALGDVRQRFERKAQDAVFQVDRRGKITIEPSQVQLMLPAPAAAESLFEAAMSDERHGVWELQLGAQPRITTELAHALNIHKLVSSFTTRHPCCRPRVTNIHRIADLLDGTVVLPGEVFSVNETLGPRTATLGFEPAPTIVRGEMDDTVGGGISQFATTFFNAVLHGGYEIIERQPHSYYFSRYPMGHEATLSFPKPDLIFKNDTQAGLLVKTRYSGTSVTVLIYGDNGGRRVKTEVSKPFDYVEPAVEYTADDSLEPDEPKTEQRGERGFSVYATRIVREPDGQEHKETRKVVYNPRTLRVTVHSCKIPEGFEGYTGEECPLPEVADAGGPVSEY